MNKVSGKFDNILTTLGTNNSSQIATAVLAGFKMFFIPLATLKDKNATAEQKKYTMTRDVITEALALSTYIGVTGQVQKHATAPICSKYYKSKAKLIEAKKIKPVNDLTKNEIDFLKNIDSKKIKEAGEDFITLVSPKHKVMPDSTKQYIDKLNTILNKINGSSKDIFSISIDNFIDNMRSNKIKKDRKGFSVLINDFKNATKGNKEIIEPQKLFQNTRIALSQVCVWVLALAVIPPLCNAIIKPVMGKLNQQKNNNVSEKKPIITSAITVKKNNPKTFGKHNYYSNIINEGNMRI